MRGVDRIVFRKTPLLLLLETNRRAFRKEGSLSIVLSKYSLSSFPKREIQAVSYNIINIINIQNIITKSIPISPKDLITIHSFFTSFFLKPLKTTFRNSFSTISYINIFIINYHHMIIYFMIKYIFICLIIGSFFFLTESKASKTFTSTTRSRRSSN